MALWQTRRLCGVITASNNGAGARQKKEEKQKTTKGGRLPPARRAASGGGGASCPQRGSGAQVMVWRAGKKSKGERALIGGGSLKKAEEVRRQSAPRTGEACLIAGNQEAALIKIIRDQTESISQDGISWQGEGGFGRAPTSKRTRLQ